MDQPLFWKILDYPIRTQLAIRHIVPLNLFNVGCSHDGRLPSIKDTNIFGNNNFFGGKPIPHLFWYVIVTYLQSVPVVFTPSLEQQQIQDFCHYSSVFGVRQWFHPQWH
jgi:hypothetical protein